MVDFKTKFYTKIWTIVMEYTDFQLIWRFETMIFMAKHFSREWSLHTIVHKLRRRSGTLGDASRKKYFNDVLFHFGQKMRLAFRSMTFETLCTFRTGYPHAFHGMLYLIQGFLVRTPRRFLDSNIPFISEINSQTRSWKKYDCTTPILLHKLHWLAAL